MTTRSVSSYVWTAVSTLAAENRDRAPEYSQHSYACFFPGLLPLLLVSGLLSDSEFWAGVAALAHPPAPAGSLAGRRGAGSRIPTQDCQSL